jgi:hypothetical protein
MTNVSAPADVFASRRGFPTLRTTLSIFAAPVIAAGTAAWIAHTDPTASASIPLSSKDTSSFFDVRFPSDMEPVSRAALASRPLFQRSRAELEIKFQLAKGQLAEQLRAVRSQSVLPSEPPSIAAAVPLPRSRPVEAALVSQSGSSTQTEGRTLLQRLSDLFPARITLASLTPSDGASRDTPDLTSLGYDDLTAVYDISAHAVYMPNGSKLEAHSGFGSLRDDPRHVSERNVGATPPHAYNLKPREQAFHGVQALRMIPIGDNNAIGRAGLLAHSYMLGPDGDSNGCVSIKDYDKFLRAFQNGEVKRLVVVASLNDTTSVSRQPAWKS